MSTLFVDTINEKTSGNGVEIPGHVVQVVHATDTNGFQTTSSSFVDTGLSATITPTSTSSKILATYSANGGVDTAARMMIFNLVRGSTNIGQPDSVQAYSGTRTIYVNGTDDSLQIHFEVYDSPATTSATTYKVQCRINGSGGMNVGRRNSNDTQNAVTLTLMEIAQ